MTEPDIARLEDEILELASKRARALAEMLAPGFIYTSSQGRRHDRSDSFGFVTSGDMRWKAQIIEDAEVHPFGDTVVLTCRVTDIRHYQSEPVRWHFISTHVYVRHGDTSLYAAGHTSSVGEEKGPTSSRTP
jgi:hypothetical protein